MKQQIKKSFWNICKVIEGTILRALLIAVLLLNASGPSPVAAQSVQQKNTVGTAPVERILPDQVPVYFNAPNIAPPPVASPTPVKPGSKVPPHASSNQIDFTISAQPGTVQVNDSFVLTVLIQNNASVADTNLLYSDILEAGLEYVVSSDSPVSYNSQTRQVSYAIASLEAGKSITFSYKLKVTAKKQNATKGAIRIHSATLNHSLGATNRGCA